MEAALAITTAVVQLMVQMEAPGAVPQVQDPAKPELAVKVCTLAQLILVLQDRVTMAETLTPRMEAALAEVVAAL